MLVKDPDLIIVYMSFFVCVLSRFVLKHILKTTYTIIRSGVLELGIIGKSIDTLSIL